MVDAAIFKNKIVSLISQDYQVEFLGHDFNQIVSLLTEAKAEKIYRWVLEVIGKTIRPIVSNSPKTYKNWAVKELLVFRHPFTIQNNEYRILFVKVKNLIYIEFHLGDHRYYDKVRKDLALKKSGY